MTHRHDDLDRNLIQNAYRHWAPIYDAVCGPVMLKGRRAAAEAKRLDTDGVICGHIHCVVIRDEHGIQYINCGDWVESCTAIAEHDDGTFEIIAWANADAPQVGLLPAPSAQAA